MGKQIADIGKFTGPRAKIGLRLLPQTCRVYPPVRVIDESGSYSEVNGDPILYNLKPDIPCRLDTTRYYRQAEIFGQEGIVSDYELHVPHDFDLHHDYKIEIDGFVYEVRKLLFDDVWRPVRAALVSRVGQGTTT